MKRLFTCLIAAGVLLNSLPRSASAGDDTMGEVASRTRESGTQRQCPRPIDGDELQFLTEQENKTPELLDQVAGQAPTPGPGQACEVYNSWCRQQGGRPYGCGSGGPSSVGVGCDMSGTGSSPAAQTRTRSFGELSPGEKALVIGAVAAVGAAGAAVALWAAGFPH